ncbi:hypothetical protein [Streptomyces sp. NPDC052811]|uniref:hypothetical protein n=2 Tax=Streptomyces TaxID=1883 RepID=UPI00341EF645
MIFHALHPWLDGSGTYGPGRWAGGFEQAGHRWPSSPELLVQPALSSSCLPERPMTVTDAVAIWSAQQRVTALLAQDHRAVDTGDLLEARARHRRGWASYEESRAALEARSMTPGFFAKPHDAEDQAREQFAAYVDQLAAETRTAGVSRRLTPDGWLAPSTPDRRRFRPTRP